MDISADLLHEVINRGAAGELLAVVGNYLGGEEGFVDDLLSILTDDPDLVHDTVLSLAGALRGNEPELRTSAAGVLGIIGEKDPALIRDLVPDLIGVLKSDDPEVRAIAAGALGYIGCLEAGLVKDAIPALADALRDPDSMVREVAAGSLETICEGDPELVKRAMPGLTAALKDHDPVVRGFAEESLKVLEAFRYDTAQGRTGDRRRWRRAGDRWMM